MSRRGQRKSFRYKEIEEIKQSVREGIYDWFYPVFGSWSLSKPAFFLQSINLTLSFIFLSTILWPVYNFVSSWVEALNDPSMRNILTLAILALTGMILNNKVSRWQSIFELNMQDSRRYFSAIFSANFVAYGIKK